MRIALIGSAPSSVQLAPYADPSWTIWGCSPGASPFVKRVDAWFELHPLSDPCVTPDYVAFMNATGKQVFLIEPSPAIPNGAAYPKDEMTKEFGEYFFTSSLAWMFALALKQNPEEIGMWGVDMSATEEYGYQRAGCHFFIQLAKSRGIKVTVPAESDLLRPPPPYGYIMGTRMYVKLAQRRAELVGRLNNAAAEYEARRNEWNFLKGAVDDLDYMLNTWVE